MLHAYGPRAIGPTVSTTYTASVSGTSPSTIGGNLQVSHVQEATGLSSPLCSVVQSLYPGMYGSSGTLSTNLYGFLMLILYCSVEQLLLAMNWQPGIQESLDVSGSCFCLVHF